MRSCIPLEDLSMFGGWGWRPRVPDHVRRAKAARKATSLERKGRELDPVRAQGRVIAHSWWGRAWCDNLDSYSDFANRLPRGRTYLRQGAVMDLHVAAGRLKALVIGSEVYEIEITFSRMSRTRWEELIGRCAGSIGSVIELLQGRFDQHVMEVIARRETGLFPSPREIQMSCTCPDWATMCKHVAAALYGVGVRLDRSPELLFTLRQVEPLDLVRHAGSGLAAHPAIASGPALASADLSEIFGIEMEDAPLAVVAEPVANPAPAAAADPSSRAGPRQSSARVPVPRRRGRPPRPPREKPVRRTRTRAVTAELAVESMEEIDSVDLLMEGLPRSRIQAWVVEGILAKTARRGIYRVTSRVASRIIRDAIRAVAGS